MPDGHRQDYRLRASRDGLRVQGLCASYDLLAMVRDAGWRVVGARSHAAKRLLKKADLLHNVEILPPPRLRWRTSLASASATNTAPANGL
jgi:hypothetical protein